MPAKKSRTSPPLKALPFSGEFSPGQVDLIWLLAAASKTTSESSFVEETRLKYFGAACPTYSGDRRLVEQTKRARNVLIGMRK
jgi:hypothetical protein